MSTSILVDNLFQVYQGDLPPLDPPSGLRGESLPGGTINLAWNEVEGAAGYQLYRQAPEETEFTAYLRFETDLEFTDEPSSDGLYAYAVASIRQANAQEAISGRSDPVELLSDSTPPGAAQNLALELTGAGVQAVWDAAPYTEPVTYSLYRSGLAEIISTEGLTPILTGIEETTAVDPNPSPTDHAYVVTAVDEVGNESAPSNSFYLNFELLPVSTLNVVQSGDAPPVITWPHASDSIAGYDFYYRVRCGECETESGTPHGVLHYRYRLYGG